MDDDRYAAFPEGFFGRMDPAPDTEFYRQPRLVTHIDDGAIAAVGELYAELGLTGELLDICSSWISHLQARPAALTVLGMNEAELRENPFASAVVVADLNTDPTLPFADSSFDGAMCAVSVDYLVKPLEVFDEVARVLRPDAPFVCTFSNRCFPTKAIRGWLATDDAMHVATVTEYFRRSGPWGPPSAEHRNPGQPGDPLFAVWARRLATQAA